MNGDLSGEQILALASLAAGLALAVQRLLAMRRDAARRRGRPTLDEASPGD